MNDFDYEPVFNFGFEVHSWRNCTNAFKEPIDIDLWLPCPACNLKPKVWRFDNGQSTACGCWNDGYYRFSVVAESVGSLINRARGFGRMDRDDLRMNWNDYCLTGVPILNQDLRELNRW